MKQYLVVYWGKVDGLEKILENRVFSNLIFIPFPALAEGGSDWILVIDKQEGDWMLQIANKGFLVRAADGRKTLLGFYRRDSNV